MELETMLKDLMKVQLRLCLNDFLDEWEDDQPMAEHLWRQYSTTYRFNLLNFYKYMATNKKDLDHFVELVRIKIKSNEGW